MDFIEKTFAFFKGPSVVINLRENIKIGQNNAINGLIIKLTTT